ncbi:uncharacterized protein Z518_06308 [Rhinocladiella mackenziei CBS 650.93]|uniref:Uncharacterized protein n=1 Tax=Rhinocladiella mackenziei CBS 650.93 TaxID=1442369 RepID=A0A0D2IQI3_9EURO|nr:uncharacterized protein Z518_06308 [Rhinocladiella mackenziei CBS 650.93]KIX05436.1 hypothetical protein Z518_06308 [Rhinocladiella mackenziei CBS 650.93]
MSHLLFSQSRALPSSCTAPRRAFPTVVARTLPSSTRKSATQYRAASKPGWTGHTTHDHAVNRSRHDAHDVQAEASRHGMAEYNKHHTEEERSGSDAISRKDEKQSNRRAKEENPEAPEPVIGMNEERGTALECSPEKEWDDVLLTLTS